MKITLGDTTLCEGQVRVTGSSSGTAGNPVGPSDLRMQLAPGVAIREYVGADRVLGEHVRCDSGSVSFGVTRTFATPEAALAYISGEFLSEDSEGALKFGGNTVFAKAAVTQRTAAHVGCTVAVNYSITG